MTQPADLLCDPAREPPTAELLPLRPGDIRVKQAVDILIGRPDYERARGDIHARLMLEWGCTKNAVEHAFTEAGRFLRIQRVPELLLEQGLAELRAIAASTAEDAPAVAVAAWKTVLDRIDKLVERAASKASGQSQTERTAAVRAMLLEPSEEFAQLLAECGWRREP